MVCLGGCVLSVDPIGDIHSAPLTIWKLQVPETATMQTTSNTQPNNQNTPKRSSQPIPFFLIQSFQFQ